MSINKPFFLKESFTKEIKENFLKKKVLSKKKRK